jgi:thioesterase domain-containing protein/acyl carrier protein
MFLDALPLSRNGKVDRRNMPAPGELTAERPRTPPRDELETAIARLVEDTVGISQVGVTDDFFALGGNSILAAVLVGRIRQTLGHRPSLAAFFQEPTVEWLAAAVRAGEPGDGDIVRLRAGETAHPPLIFFAPIGGGLGCYRELIDRLPAGPAVFGLPSPGLAADTTPEADLPRLVARQAAAIRRAGIAAPYRLVGWSYGGVLAAAVAAELVDQGLAVRPPVLIDSYPVVGPASTSELAAEFVASFARSQNLPLPADRQPDTADPLGWITSELRETGIRPNLVDDEHIARFWRVFLANSTAARTYRPARLLGPMVLLRPERPGSPEQGPANGWSDFAAAVDVRTVPGDHYSVLGGAGAAEVAGSLML